MNIAENILKHDLQNVYFLTGTALAGKTTMTKKLSEKHGVISFHDNWHEENFILYRSICNEKYQKHSTQKKETTDWEAFFGRSVEEFLSAGSDYGENDEYLEFAIIELIKLSQKNKVIADISIPIKLLVEISDYNRIACLLASPELVTCENYGKRDDHKEFLDCIMSLKEPEKKIKTQDELFSIAVQRIFDDVEKYSLFKIVRKDESTIENTLRELEKHFKLG
jgi:hypothetical protein